MPHFGFENGQEIAQEQHQWASIPTLETHMNNTHVYEVSASSATTHGQSLELFLWWSISCSLQQPLEQ